MPETVAALQTLVANAIGVGEPDSPWFIADNLITFGHTHGFLTDPRFIAAVNSEHPAHDELSIIWRTHTLCWAAESCLGVAGDYVECGCYRGYSMAVVLRYLAGLPGRHCYLYDLFDPTGGEGKASAWQPTRPTSSSVSSCGSAHWTMCRSSAGRCRKYCPRRRRGASRSCMWT